VLIGALLLALAVQDSAYARAESLFAAHDLPAARRAAEHLVATYPHDAQAHLILGRVWLAWPVIGRYYALSEFRLAARLTPSDPEPLYWQVRVGQYLGSDEGEVMVREAILKIFALTPEYQDCWALFARIYHNADIWRRADRALAHHPHDVVALERRATIAIALEDPARADSLAALVLARRTPHLPSYLLRAESAFHDRRDAAGYAWYDSALTYADLDSTGALSAQVWMIASPAEIAREHGTLPGDRRSYFKWFWGKRDPNLLTPENERIAEHFRRLAYVRRMFHLLHPWAGYHHSVPARTLQAYGDRVHQQELVKSVPGVVTRSADSALLANRLGARTAVGEGEDLQFRAGLDGRGLFWIRHGRPEVRMTGVLDPIRGVPGRPLDESWIYVMPWGDVVLSFGSPGGGDTRSLPFTRRQLASQRRLLEADRTTIPATLEARGWSAFFKSDDEGNTELYVRTQHETAAVVLWDTGGAEEIVRAAGAGLLTVSAPPGFYDLGLDADSGGALARVRQQVRLPAFSWASLSLSSLILAPADTLTDRETTLRGMPAALVYPSGRPLAAYAEVYGLTRDDQGRARYRVRYTFKPLQSITARLFGGGSPVVFEFDREDEWRGTIAERLVIEPGRIPPGRYRVMLAVTDLLSNVKSESVAVDITRR